MFSSETTGLSPPTTKGIVWGKKTAKLDNPMTGNGWILVAVKGPTNKAGITGTKGSSDVAIGGNKTIRNLFYQPTNFKKCIAVV